MDIGNASPEDLTHGLAAAFRADETPPFEEMVQKLFRESDGDQRAAFLNHLAQSLPPIAIGALGTGPLGTLLQRARRGQPVTPMEAGPIKPDDVEQAAHQAAARDPGIIERISSFYARHPALVQTLGSMALNIALNRIAQRRGGERSEYS
jgi:hypothetical protein